MSICPAARRVIVGARPESVSSERAESQSNTSLVGPVLWLVLKIMSLFFLSLFSLIKDFPAVLPRAVRSNEQLIFVKSFEDE